MKKLFSILTALVLSLQLTTVFAAEGDVITVEKKTGKPGDTVTVKVKLEVEDEDNVQWSNIGFTLAYDDTALELTDASIRAAGATGVVPDVMAGTINQNPIVASLVTTGISDYSGEIVRFKFKIKENAAGGTYPLTIDWFKGENGDYVNGVNVNFIMDANNNKTPFTVGYESGSITVDAPAAPAEPTLAAAKTADGVTITATHPTAITGKFIVAAYDADGLANVEVLTAGATVTSTVKGDNVKVMWWDSLEGLNSIVPAVLAK